MSLEISRINIRPIKYVYELPFESRRRICDLLDLNDVWKELGGKHMQFDCFTLNRISKAVYRRESPTEELLQLWGNQNHSILELFALLNRMKHYHAMKVLQPFVDEKYHVHIRQGMSRIDLNQYEDRLETVLEISDSVSNNSNRSEIARRQNQINPSVSQDNQRNRNTTAERKPDLSDFHDLASFIPHINYKELELATNSWDRSNILGRGGFGVVFKGIWRQSAVAIKRLEPQKGNEVEFNALEVQRQQSFRELKHLNSCRHDNILPLYGYSVGEDKYCLIYQYMPNGSLEDRIQCRHGSKPLSWLRKYNIAAGTAKGLQFLHDMDKPLVHGDIKSANILLDHHFEAKIGDFGLAREGPSANSTHIKVSRVHGTRPYLPDEFLRGKKFSPKVDTYSFGVVLFELATGLRAYDDSRRDKFLRDHVINCDEEKIPGLIDPKVSCENIHLFKNLIELGKKCAADRPRERPEMSAVSVQLDSDRDTFSRALTNLRLTSSITPNRVDPTGRRPSLLPGTASVTPELWIFATPQPSMQPLPIRRSPSPTNLAPTGQGLKQVSEEDPNESISATGNSELKKGMAESAAPNFPPVPGIVLTTPDSRIPIPKSVNSETIFSTLESSLDSDFSDVTDEQKPAFNDELENKETSSDNVLIPAVTVLQNWTEPWNDDPVQISETVDKNSSDAPSKSK